MVISLNSGRVTYLGLELKDTGKWAHCELCCNDHGSSLSEEIGYMHTMESIQPLKKKKRKFFNM